MYGDLDISILDELPPGRQKTETYCVSQALHERIYKFIKKHLDRGFQAYIVCPLVEEGDSDLIPAQEYTSFTKYRIQGLQARTFARSNEAQGKGQYNARF